MICFMSAIANGILDVDAGSRLGAKSTDTRYESLKPSLDSLLAALLLLVSAPVILIATLLVRLTSRGPAIYTQKRLGQGGRTITIYKIRTMCQDSERETGPTWSVPGDARVTPVGRFLRWAHLDELPQLVNILRGEMSLVGPRPERPELAAQIERALPRYRRRLTVRPGLTGLAQVRQRPDTDLSQRPPQAELRPLLPGTDEFLARPPRAGRHGPQMLGGAVRNDWQEHRMSLQDRFAPT